LERRAAYLLVENDHISITPRPISRWP
jgi:hypothetical protein